MEVIFISHKYPPSIGGMQKQSYELINGFESYGKAYRLTPEHDESKVYFFWKLRSRVRTLLKQNHNISLIHCNDGLCGFLAMQLLRGVDIPVVVTFHGLDLLWPNGFYQKWLTSSGLKKFAGIIGVSSFTADEAIKRGADPKKVSVVLNGVDEPDWSMAEVRADMIQYVKSLESLNKKVVVSIGRPVKRKGFNWFIQKVLPMLDDKIHYVIIGPRTERSRFHELIRKVTPKALLNNIDLFFGANSAQNELMTLLGNDKFKKRFDWFHDLNYHELQFMLSISSLSVMPNISVAGDAEGFGLVSLEANMHEKYVVAADIDGIPSAVRDKLNGRLLPPEQEMIWAQVINDFCILSPEEAQRKGVDSKQFVLKTFSWSKMVNGTAGFFETVIR